MLPERLVEYLGTVKMSYTLQRKMFKLGGSVAHGGGVTSGLKLNKGGKVAPIGQVGKGPLHMKGPDGKMREMQNPLAYLARLGFSAIAPGAQTFMKAARGGQGLKGLEKFIRGSSRKKTPLKFDSANPIRTTTSRGTTTRSNIIGGGEKIPLTASQVAGRAGRAGILGLPFGGLGAILSPTIDTDETSSVGMKALEKLQDFGRLPAQIPLSLFDALSGTSEQLGDNIMGYGPASQAVFGTKPKEEIKMAQGSFESSPETEAAIKQAVKEREESAFDTATEEAYGRLGGNDARARLLALSQGLTQAASPLLEEDYGGAAAAFTKGAGDVIEGERALKQTAAGLVMQEEQADKAMDRAILTEVYSKGTPEEIARTEKFVEARNVLGTGNVDPLPTKGKNKPDSKAMRSGKVYTDLTGATSGLYVAVNENMNPPFLQTNDPIEAGRFAKAEA